MKSGTIWYSPRYLSLVRNCFHEWTNGSDRQRRIMNPSRSPHRHITRRQHLLPKREGTSKNSRHFASGKHGGVATQWPRNDSQIWPSSLAMYANAVTIDRSVACEKFVALHPRRMTASLLLADCRLVGYFFTLYFFYFVAFQEFTMLQSPNRHVLG